MVLSKLMTQAREAGAFARQAFLLPRDTLAPVLPRHVEPGDHVVVFLHGLFATAGVTRPLRQRIERHRGVRTAALSYPPGPGARSLAARLDALLSVLPSSAQIHLLGHSLGGIVARHYALTANDPRIRSTIALATPFGGVRSARVLGFEGARDLDPDGEVLRHIRLARHAAELPHLSISAGEDVVTGSPHAHALPYGEHVVIQGIGHNTILFDEDAMSHVERRVLSLLADAGFAR